MKKTASRPTWAEIKLDNIGKNLNCLKGRLPGETKILAVVKANAYGHGMVEVAQYLSGKVDYLGVATVDEGIVLRDWGITTPILVMSGVLKKEVLDAVKNNLTITVFTIDLAEELQTCAVKTGINAKVHVKIDTGMKRIGLTYKKAEDFILKLMSLKNVIIEGIYTHFPNAENDEDFTLNQVKLFENLLKKLFSKKFRPKYIHVSNSAASFKYYFENFNLVRPGLVLYGIRPFADYFKEIKLFPALSLKSRITYIKKIKKGESVSYGRTFVADKDTFIGTVPIGYADGYMHSLSNKARVILKNKYVPVAGRICMDQMMLNLNGISGVSIEDTVILIGKDKDKEISVEELADISGTIPYEILCSISGRVPRIYV